MQRQEIIALVERRALDTARRLFDLSQDSLSLGIKIGAAIHE